MNSNLSSRIMMGAAIVGIAAAASMYIYEKIVSEKRRTMLAQEISKLDRKVTNMSSELESLRKLQNENRLKRQRHKKMLKKPNPPSKELTVSPERDVVDAPEVSYLSDSEYFTDYQSVADSEMDSEEFYDVKTDEEDDTLKETSWNGNHSDMEIDQESPIKSKLLKNSLNHSS